ncbi:MbeD/MobD family mobilization/exclusion protein [Klebsiella pneumoniae]|nr:MbeD/MobD family mobilization/exclusion protein [Klebsiella pneumoniae]
MTKTMTEMEKQLLSALESLQASYESNSSRRGRTATAVCSTCSRLLHRR